MFLWTRRMQFWQPGRKILDKKPTNFHSMSENDEKIYIFFKLNISQDDPLDTSNAVLKTLPKIFLRKADHFSLSFF